MANLSDEIVTTVFNLQRQLWKLINEVASAEWMILEQYGETQTTIPPLDQLQSGRERLRASYSRLYTIMLRVGESQPITDSATLNSLLETIERSQATIPAIEASVQEAKRDLNLP